MKKLLATISALFVLVTLFAFSVPFFVSAEVDTSRWSVSDGVTFNDEGTIDVSNSQYATFKDFIDFTDPNLDVSVKFTAPFANADQFVLVYLTKEPTAAIGDGSVVSRFCLDNNKYGLNYSWLNGTDFGGYGGGYVDFANGSVTIRIKNDDGVVRLYMDGNCIYHSDHATKYSDAVTGLGSGYLSVSVMSNNGPITATILEVNGATPVTVEAPATTTTEEETTTTTEEETTTTTEEETTTTTEEETTTTTEGETTTTTAAPVTQKEYKASDWKSTNAVFNDDGSITVNNGGFVSLSDAIDMTASNLDISWTFTIDQLAHALAVDSENFTIFFYDPEGNVIPAADQCDSFYRPRFYIDDLDTLIYSEAIVGTNANLAWGGTDLPMEEDQTVVLRLHNDNGLLRLTVNGKQYIPNDEHMKIFSDYLKNAGTLYFGYSIMGENAAMTLESINGVAAYEAEEAGSTTTTVVAGSTTTTVADGTTTTTTTDGSESPDTGVAGMAGVLAVVALAAVTGGMLTMKKRA